MLMVEEKRKQINVKPCLLGKTNGKWQMEKWQTRVGVENMIVGHVVSA